MLNKIRTIQFAIIGLTAMGITFTGNSYDDTRAQPQSESGDIIERNVTAVGRSTGVAGPTGVPASPEASNASNPEQGNATEPGVTVGPSLDSLAVSETGTIVDRCENRPNQAQHGCVQVVTKCTIASHPQKISCDPLVSRLFSSIPYVFLKNTLSEASAPIISSDRGRMVEIGVPSNGSIPYEIKNLLNEPIIDRLFHVYPSYGSDCNSELEAGQTKTCTIDLTLSVRRM
jgi:hypothetical protein